VSHTTTVQTLRVTGSRQEGVQGAPGSKSRMTGNAQSFSSRDRSEGVPPGGMVRGPSRPFFGGSRGPARLESSSKTGTGSTAESDLEELPAPLPKKAEYASRGGDGYE